MGTPNDMYQPHDHISGSNKYGDSNQLLGETSQLMMNERSGGSGSDSGQVTGPVNQPTLFGSSIKAQNQWQRDEKEKFIKLLQIHGRNWQVISE